MKDENRIRGGDEAAEQRGEPESQPAGEHDLRERVEIVAEWLAMAKDTPKPLNSSLNYVPICPSEIEAVESILSALQRERG